VSRRARSLAFLVAALICALLAAAIAGRYRSRVESQYGPLRPVLVATSELPAGQPIGPGRARAALAIRRVPASFIPPGALTNPADTLGRAPAVAIPSGSYVLGVQLAVPEPESPRTPEAGAGRRPVQVSIAGAEALMVDGTSPEGSRVDVVVSQQGGLGHRARAYIAATEVRLLALKSPGEPGEGWSATLALSEPQALDLIGAQSAGREIRLLPR